MNQPQGGHEIIIERYLREEERSGSSQTADDKIGWMEDAMQ